MMKKVIGKLRKKSSEKKAVSAKPKKRVFKKISPEELQSLIADKAYSFYVERGFIHGNDQLDWYRAEKSVMASLKK
ncbi:MAG: DUF2934 domain-containing protein [Candidatus Omnitrophota bacterium]